MMTGYLLPRLIPYLETVVNAKVEHILESPSAPATTVKEGRNNKEGCRDTSHVHLFN